MRTGIIGTTLWIGLAACIGVGLFVVKHEVKDQERRLRDLNAQIFQHQQDVHVLRAEWAYLNDPTRLRAQAERHLAMRTIQPTQMASLDQVLRDGFAAPVTRLADTRTKATPSATIPLRPAEPARTSAPARTSEPARAIARPAAPSVPSPPPRLARVEPPPPPAVSEPPSALAAMPAAPVAPASTAAATQTARGGGRSIVIRSPALAQGESAFDAEAR